MDVFEKAMGVIQNNVANASTPGYVTQTLDLSATAFQPGSNLYGGVQSDGVQDSRNLSAERAVWSQNEALGTATQQSSSLSSLQSLFNVSGTSGIPAALSSLYSAFSAWSTTPSSSTAQQQVLSAASQVAQAFNTTATGVNQLAAQNGSQLQSTVSQINQLSSQIAQLNGQLQTSGGSDAGVSASLYNDLETLSNLTSISVQTQSDGTVAVSMGGQTPLVTGTTQFPISVSLAPAGSTYPTAPPGAQILSFSGQDVTNVVSQGTLAGLLQFQNTTLPSVVGNGTQQGSLNILGQSVADQVNTLLTNGEISAGPPAVPGVALFTYTAGTSVAQTLAVSSTITGSQLAAIDPTTGVANGTADALSQLATTTAAAGFGASNTVDLNTATGLLAGPATQTYTFQIGTQTVPATVTGSATGISGTAALSQLNSTLSAYGITAGTDSNGALQFSGATAFTVSDGGPVPPSATGVSNEAGGSSVNIGLSSTDFYSSIAADLGNQASNAATEETTQTQLLTQAQNMRSQLSGVSLNDQAAQLLQFQQAYEAAAQMVSTINQTLSQFITDMEQA